MGLLFIIFASQVFFGPPRPGSGVNRKTENPLLAKMPVYKSNYILLFLDKTTKYQVQELHTDFFFIHNLTKTVHISVQHFTLFWNVIKQLIQNNTSFCPSFQLKHFFEQIESNLQIIHS